MRSVFINHGLFRLNGYVNRKRKNLRNLLHLRKSARREATTHRAETKSNRAETKSNRAETDYLRAIK